MRASDADREQVVERLHSAAAEGRLDADEFDRRLDAAFAATTDSQLEPLTADLPAPAPQSPRRPRIGVSPEWRAYLSVMALLVAIWALTGTGYFWPVWPALGWGLGLVLGGGACSHPGRIRAKRHTPA